MKVILQRVCWNTRGWMLPSGSTFENAFPGEKGYAHEEWNFQLEDAVDGYLYPYTYSSPNANRIGGEDAVFKMVLFTQQPISGKWLIVGVFYHAQLMKLSDYRAVMNEYDERGIFDRRATELEAVADQCSHKKALKEVKNAFRKKWIKIKARADLLEVFAVPREIAKPNNHRFTTFTYIDDIPEEALAAEDTGNREPLTEDGYPRETGVALKYIIPRHNILSNALATYLRDLGADVVQESGNVDVEFSFNGRSYLAELKVTLYSTTRHSLREALGQLLEYNFYPGRETRDRWLVILDKSPSADDHEYLGVLRSTLFLPLYIGWKKTECEFEFEEAIAKDL